MERPAESKTLASVQIDRKGRRNINSPTKLTKEYMTSDELLRARLKPMLDRIMDATELALRLQKAWVGWATLNIARKLNKGRYD